jgi:hypothetical protein
VQADLIIRLRHCLDMHGNHDLCRELDAIAKDLDENLPQTSKATYQYIGYLGLYLRAGIETTRIARLGQRGSFWR